MHPMLPAQLSLAAAAAVGAEPSAEHLWRDLTRSDGS
jgi:hypothetical protein